MSTKKEQIEKLNIFFQGEIFQQRKDWIRETCHPLIMRTSDQDDWQITTDEAQQILRTYAPALSLVIVGPTMVVFFDRKNLL